jgi:hypothetical protein
MVKITDLLLSRWQRKTMAGFLTRDSQICACSPPLRTVGRYALPLISLRSHEMGEFMTENDLNVLRVQGLKPRVHFDLEF